MLTVWRKAKGHTHTFLSRFMGFDRTNVYTTQTVYKRNKLELVLRSFVWNKLEMDININLVDV